MSVEIRMKPLSTLEKCFLDEHIDDKQEMTDFTVLRGQPLCYQVGVYCEEPGAKNRGLRCTVKVEGSLAEFATVRTVVSVPNHFPCFDGADEHYLRRTPGLYPDLIRAHSEEDG